MPNSQEMLSEASRWEDDFKVLLNQLKKISDPVYGSMELRTGRSEGEKAQIEELKPKLVELMNNGENLATKLRTGPGYDYQEAANILAHMKEIRLLLIARGIRLPKHTTNPQGAQDFKKSSQVSTAIVKEPAKTGAQPPINSNEQTISKTAADPQATLGETKPASNNTINVVTQPVTQELLSINSNDQTQKTGILGETDWGAVKNTIVQIQQKIPSLTQSQLTSEANLVCAIAQIDDKIKSGNIMMQAIPDVIHCRDHIKKTINTNAGNGPLQLYQSKIDKIEELRADIARGQQRQMPKRDGNWDPGDIESVKKAVEMLKQLENISAEYGGVKDQAERQMTEADKVVKKIVDAEIKKYKPYIIKDEIEREAYEKIRDNIATEKAQIAQNTKEVKILYVRWSALMQKMNEIATELAKPSLGRRFLNWVQRLTPEQINVQKLDKKKNIMLGWIEKAQARVKPNINQEEDVVKIQGNGVKIDQDKIDKDKLSVLEQVAEDSRPKRR